ncbi:hypothetical protein EI77_04257 [Prosthecobacter fusiformis]|uniref:Uncharacterized protein n=1 Tax=Prosthecobacter fusiformis TaxID=48464 RepID=A0A4R7RKW5_9BACT|nr:hypothetical protein EI77_04257 [Prosthecobacter fusiformis]
MSVPEALFYPTPQVMAARSRSSAQGGQAFRQGNRAGGFMGLCSPEHTPLTSRKQDYR